MVPKQGGDMSKLVKGIKKAVKGIVKGVKKVFKKITKSTFGKVLLGAAAIWLGGAAFGLWNTPFKAVNGAFVKSSAGQLAQTGTTQTLEGAAGAAGGAEGLAVGTEVSIGEAGKAVVNSAADTAVSSIAAAPTTAGSALQAAQTGAAIPQAASGAISSLGPEAISLAKTAGATKQATGPLAWLGRQGSKIANFTKENPLAATMLYSGAASALAEDPADAMRRQSEEHARFAYGNIDFGESGASSHLQRPTGNQLTHRDGTPVYQPGGVLQRLRQRSSVYNGG